MTDCCTQVEILEALVTWLQLAVGALATVVMGLASYVVRLHRAAMKRSLTVREALELVRNGRQKSPGGNGSAIS